MIDHQLPCDTHNTYDVLLFGDSIYTTVIHDPDTLSEWISVVSPSNASSPTSNSLLDSTSSGVPLTTALSKTHLPPYSYALAAIV